MQNATGRDPATNGQGRQHLGGIHSISDGLCVYLEVLGRWRNEPLAFYRNAQRGGAVKASFVITVFLLKMATCQGARASAGCGSPFGRFCFESADSLHGTDEDCIRWSTLLD